MGLPNCLHGHRDRPSFLLPNLEGFFLNGMGGGSWSQSNMPITLYCPTGRVAAVAANGVNSGQPPAQSWNFTARTKPQLYWTPYSLSEILMSHAWIEEIQVLFALYRGRRAISIFYRMYLLLQLSGCRMFVSSYLAGLQYHP